MKKELIINRLNSVKRMRILENRDLKKGLRLNRNERVEDFPKGTLQKIFNNIPKYNLGKYPDHSVIYKYLSKHLNLKQENILLSSGIDGSLKTIFETMLKPRDKVAFLDPSYAMYNVFSKIYKINTFKINYNANFKLDKKKIYDAVKKGSKILFIPNPNQPIEDNLNIYDLKKICNFCQLHKCLVVIDEAYHMYGAVSAKGLCKIYDNLIVLRTFSKSFGLPSIRLGYIISNAKIIRLLETYRLSYESNFLTDTVAIYFLKNKTMVENYIKKVINGREFVKKQLNKKGIRVYGKTSNCLLIKLPSQIQHKKITKALSKEKIYVKSNYQGLLKDCILITCGPITYMKKLIKVINKNI